MSTIKDVALYAGVSTATVSRVINNDKVRATTKNRVLKAIDALGYTPNIVARTLKTSFSKTIGVLVTDFSDSYSLLLVKHIDQILSSDGYSMLICSSNNKQFNQKAKIDLLEQHNVDAILAFPCSSDTSGFSNLIEKGIPLILVNHSASDFATDVVFTDNNPQECNDISQLLADTIVRRIQGDYSDFPICYSPQ